MTTPYQVGASPNTGGRVTPAVIQDVAYAGYLVDTKAPDGPDFEVAIIHYTDCGSSLLEDGQLRHDFAERGGYDEHKLAALPVTGPAQRVRTEVERLRAAPQISGHTVPPATSTISTRADHDGAGLELTRRVGRRRRGDRPVGRSILS